jgi:hypothetical protein
MRSTGMPEGRRAEAETVLAAYCQALGSPAEHRAPVENACPDRVYFVSCEAPDFPVKIGITSNVPVRLAALRCALPYPVILLADIPGDADVERSLHIGFAESRLEGEWFSRTPELMSYIEGLKK